MMQILDNMSLMYYNIHVAGSWGISWTMFPFAFFQSINELILLNINTLTFGKLRIFVQPI